MKLITPNEYYDEIFCLNIKRRFDKWKKVQQRFVREHIHVKRFEGIDGFDKKEDYKLFVKTHTKWRWTIGNYAVLQSFIKLYEHIKKASYERVLIFEDDVVFHKNFNVLFDQYIKEIPNDWDVVYLGATQWDWNNLDYVNNKFFKSKSTTGNFAISVTQKAVSDIIPILKYSLNEGIYTCDQTFNVYLRENLNMYVAFPFLISHDYGYSDTAMKNFDKYNTLGYTKPRWYDEKIYN